MAGPTDVPPETRSGGARRATAGREHATCATASAIELSKGIPVQGGLGGGSSDAATVLVALNRLWRVGLRLDDLAELGLTLGADVPVFVRGQAAWAEGVGEQLTPNATSLKASISSSNRGPQ